MSGANGVVWTGPAQNSSDPTPVTANDPFGMKRIWMTAIYANDREINPYIPNYKRLRVIGSYKSGDFDLEIRNVLLSDEGYYRCSIDPGKEMPLDFKVYILLLKSKFIISITQSTNETY